MSIGRSIIGLALTGVLLLILFGSIGLPQIIFLLFLAFLLLIYIVPTIVAFKRDKRNRIAIFVLNILLGWTLIGWVVALVWSLTVDERHS